MNYEIGELLTDCREEFKGEIGIVIDIFSEYGRDYYKVYWTTGPFAGRQSDEPCEYHDNIEKN